MISITSVKRLVDLLYIYEGDSNSLMHSEITLEHGYLKKLKSAFSSLGHDMKIGHIDHPKPVNTIGQTTEIFPRFRIPSHPYLPIY